MSWEITIVAGVIVAILVLFLKSKGSAKTEDTAPNETSRRLLANFVDQNRRRIAGMSDDEKVDIESKLAARS
ncbi:hypothetical protein J2Z31_001837 [Sinorhizobium kostiense]|uniref:Transmembrane protein n=1 Tax=Sinorhizobium kostiense TaxID=76747 RepID=A0ABS4QXG5_9HYPH|nr:hypothetical protein [Sinorhizobium kostiense]